MIDDGSTDDSISLARRKGVEVFPLQVQSGVSFARNFGDRHANGAILLFIDSDVIVRRETIALIVASFLRNPDFVAVFGSY